MTEKDLIIQDLRRKNAKLRARVPEWISVDDRLPEDDSDTLAYLQIGEEGRIYPANYAKGVWFDCSFDTPVTESTTHWMPIPEKPKGE